MTTINSVGNGLAGTTGSGNFVGSTSPTLVTPVLGAATSTSLAFSPTTGGIIGTTAADNAGAGKVGEFISSQILSSGSTISLTASTPANITSISLTAGDWDVWGNFHLTGGATTVLILAIGWISTTSATVPDSALTTYLNYGASGTTVFAVSSVGFDVPYTRINISGTTTVYLSVDALFSTSTCNAYGAIYARRVR